MLTDPQTITIDTVPTTLNCVAKGDTRSVYSSADGNLKLTVSHTESGNKTAPRARHLVRLDVRKVAADPLTAVNAYKTQGLYFVIDDPDFGFNNEETNDNVQGLMGLMIEAFVTDVLEYQH